jgi:hypothetical protein
MHPPHRAGCPWAELARFIVRASQVEKERPQPEGLECIPQSQQRMCTGYKRSLVSSYDKANGSL